MQRSEKCADGGACLSVEVLTLKLELEQTSVQFEGVKALDGISLEINENATTVLLGTSGSGKSTVLKTFLGLLTPTAGRVLVNGQEMRRADFHEMRGRIGYMTQNGGLFPHLTIRDNIVILAQYQKWPRAKTEVRLEQLLHLTRLESNLLHRYPHEVSGGQRQRAALSRAILHDPPTLFLDEPLGALDPLTRYDMQKDLKSIFRALNKTVVLVTHDLYEARFFGDIIHVFDAGRIVQSGRFKDLESQPANNFVKKFLEAYHAEERE